MKNIIKLSLITGLMMASTACQLQNKKVETAQHNNQDYNAFVQKIDKEIPQWLASMNIPGASFALIHHGQVVFEKGYGFADQQNDVKVTPETGFNLGSISKTLTAWGVMKLVEKGLLDIDQPVDKYLTRWHLPQSEFSNKEVTIRRILSHTAGLSVHGFPGYSNKDDLPSITQVLNGQSNTNQTVEVIQKPGQSFRYSGGGTTILQLLIEEVSGLSYETYMQQEVFEPLGMHDSSFTIDDQILSQSSLAHNESGAVIPLVLFTAKAAAGAHSTLSDFSQFALASLDSHKYNNGYKGGQSLLKPTKIDEMTSLATNSNETGLGYQVKVIKDNLMTVVGHEGNNDGWNALFALDRAAGDGFVMLTNGGSYRNVYRLIECQWLEWKLSKDHGIQCEDKLAKRLNSIYQTSGVDAMLSDYKAREQQNIKNHYFIYGQEYFFNKMGDDMVKQGKSSDAAEVFKFNHDSNPDSFNAYYKMAELLIETNQLQIYHDMTEKQLKALKKVNKAERADQLIYIGIQLKQIGAYKKAERVLQETFDIRSQTAPQAWTTFNTQSHLGEVHMHLKNYKKAYDMTTKAYQALKKRVDSIYASGRKLRMQEALNRVLAVIENGQNQKQKASWQTEQAFIDAL